MTKLTLYHDVFRCTSDKADPPEMILIHGWGLHSLVWDDVMPGLLENFQVTVVDLPGLGRSPMPAGEYDLDYLVNHVLSIAPEKAVWVGWSLGGLVAMAAASRFPERVSALISVCSSPQFTASPAWPAAMREDILQGFIDVFEEDWEGTLIRFLALQCKDSATIKKDIRQLKELMLFHGLPAQKALRAGLKILKNTSLLEELPRIQAPTLHVFGENDNLVPVGVSAMIKEVQPDCETSVIRSVSHVPF
ncbi:MAG: pimeloyl-ACP methyl ester esterase BioH, partial [Ketobacteraceae bacterium]|nr:pimeloyl-ACP methyl ester esterase BioH [Ketobacteraceae bacterium]